MVDGPLLRHLLSDNESLEQFLSGKMVSIIDIFRRLLLAERSINTRLPDHYYRLKQTQEIGGLKTTTSIFITGLCKLASEYLEFNGNRITVREPKHNQWQQLITYIPPLLLQAAFLHQESPPDDWSDAGLVNYHGNILIPNFRFTAIPSPEINALRSYVASQQGLHDLHMHLNGSTETDISWQDQLVRPAKIYREIKSAYGESKVREQLEQESRLLDPLKYYRMLQLARLLRRILYKIIVTDDPQFPNWVNKENIITYLLTRARSENYYASYRNPFSLANHSGSLPESLMTGEALMYLRIFNHLQEEPNDTVAGIFHFYLLVLGLCNRLLVQQEHQYGFEQFQKHTLNGLRETTELHFRSRFFQLQGNELNNLAFLEGRFSPKASEGENVALLMSIYRGWEKLKKVAPNQPMLKLTAHFIKRADSKPDPYIRHKKLRTDVWKRAQVLKLLKKNQPAISQNITGIDAAASEFDAPPEVFAPTFRMLRRSKRFNHFTYHAGEDFFHLIGGLRAIYEAIEFNGLAECDRIGHATAAGLDATQWANVVGNEMCIHKGEWLDDLIFTRYILKGATPQVEQKIKELSYNIYGKVYTIDNLEKAWLCRKYCPILLFKRSRDEASYSAVFDECEWTDITTLRLDPQDDVYQLLRLYHANRKEYNQVIRIASLELFTTAQLIELQKILLKYMARKKIVIETLPTSNVRIGHHPDFSTYHLWNWIDWANTNPNDIPKIVIGTDDTGIFATNIYNEAANIFSNLKYERGKTDKEALSVIETLNGNGIIYRFL